MPLRGASPASSLIVRAEMLRGGSGETGPGDHGNWESSFGGVGREVESVRGRESHYQGLAGGLACSWCPISVSGQGK